MREIQRAFILMVGFVGLLVGTAWPARGQVGKGLIDPNVASQADLLGLPHMTAAVVKDLMTKRPFMNILDLNAFLLAEKFTPDQATEFYRKSFVNINLDTGTREEFVLIPGAGNRMAKEFAEYRPWKSWIQFDKEIGKYVGQQEADRYKQYMFIPININAAPDDILLTIPGITSTLVQALKKSRPWKSSDQFSNEIGKAFGPKEAQRLWRYFVIS
jgi:DNA uptake protein ComE-like DNA-binding protein